MRIVRICYQWFDDTERSAWVDLLVLSLLFGFLYWGFAWIRPFANPDEGRYVEIPRQMWASGDWVTPRLNGVLYFEKPPAFYWLQALAIGLFKGGDASTEWVGRFWNNALGLIGVVATYGLGRSLYGRRVGLWSGLVLGASALYYAMAHVITLDMMLAVVTAGALYAFILARRFPLASARRRYTFLLAYGLLALAVLTKGLVGLLIPGAIVSIWLTLTGRWRDLSSYHIPEGSFLFLLLAVPWHVLAALRTPAFTWYYFVHEQFLRYLQPLHNREQPFWFFIFIFVVGFFPFTLLVPRALSYCFLKPWRQLKSQEPELLLLGVWALFVPLFYSFSHSKLAPYILPCFFPWAIIVARYIDVAWTAPQVYTGLRVATKRFSYTLLAAAVVLPPLAWWGLKITAKLFWLPAMALVLCLLGSFISIQRSLRGSPQKAWLMALCALGPIMLAVQPMVGAARFPGTKPHAQFLRQHTQPEAKIFQIFNYYQDFNPYLGRLTHVVDRPEEQCFGLSLEDQSERYPEPTVFFDAWQQTEETWYGIIRTKHLPEFTHKVGAQKVHPIFQTQHYWVISNQPLSSTTL